MDMEESTTSFASSSEMETTSTRSESSLSHIPYHDIVVFGLSSDLNDLNLPTSRDILRYYFLLSERAKIESKMVSYKTCNR